MTLREYIQAFHPDRTQKEIADDIGISRSFLNQILNGTRNAPSPVIAKIRLWSGGCVDADTFLFPDPSQTDQQDATSGTEAEIQP